MSLDFSGKVVIITGSSSGIGQAAALLFAQAGACVTIHGRSEEGLKKTVKLVQDCGIDKKKIHIVQGCITCPEVQKRLIDETVDTFGRIDVLINNAGGSKEDDPNPRSMANLDYSLDLNLKAPIALTELAIPHLEKTKGNIINVSSIASQNTMTIAPFYAITKAGLDHFARNYAAILAPKHIRINNLNPGPTDTAILTRSSLPKEVVAKIMEFYQETIPLGRVAESKEMAEFLLFMASEKASYMTGGIVNLDGGLLIKAHDLKLE